MKKLTRIHLHNLSQAELAKREENMLKGGVGQCACAGIAYCACAYAGVQTNPNFYGGSSSDSNSDANFYEEVTRKNQE